MVIWSFYVYVVEKLDDKKNIIDVDLYANKSVKSKNKVYVDFCYVNKKFTLLGLPYNNYISRWRVTLKCEKWILNNREAFGEKLKTVLINPVLKV